MNNRLAPYASHFPDLFLASSPTGASGSPAGANSPNPPNNNHFFAAGFIAAMLLVAMLAVGLCQALCFFGNVGLIR